MKKLLFLLLFLPISARAEVFTSLLTPTTGLEKIDPTSVLIMVNNIRISNNLWPVWLNPELTKVAQIRADDMAKNGYFDHTDWLNQLGKVNYPYCSAGENLAEGFTFALDVQDSWFYSAEHKSNMLASRFKETGVGVAKGKYKGMETMFVVQEFATPKNNCD